MAQFFSFVDFRGREPVLFSSFYPLVLTCQVFEATPLPYFQKGP